MSSQLPAQAAAGQGLGMFCLLLHTWGLEQGQAHGWCSGFANLIEPYSVLDAILNTSQASCH